MNGDLTHGPVMKTMLRFAIPMIVGNLLQQCYNVADTLIVGRFLGANALAAVGSSYTPVSYTHLDVYKRQVPGNSQFPYGDGSPGQVLYFTARKG